MRQFTNTKFVPLLGALKQIQFWLEGGEPPVMMAATPTMEGFLSQKLPAHCKVAKRKLRGPRELVRGRSVSSENAGAYARWPKDDLVEGVRSMLAIVLHGNPVLRVADYQVQCKPGDMLFTPGHLPRWDKALLPRERAALNENNDFLIFFGGAPDMSFVHVRISRYRRERLIDLDEGEACWIRSLLMGQLFIGLEEYLQKEHRNKNALQFLQLHIALFMEKMETGCAFDTQPYPSDSPLSRRQEPIEHAQVYVRNHLERDLSIDVLANWVGMSRSTFTRHFRVKTGQTFTEYLIDQRIEQAKVLLSETDLSITRVCEQVGLKPWRLRELFQERCHITPTNYRKEQK